MQILIKIDEETLQDLYDSRYVSPHIKEALRKGTPLPKGHGRLIDANELLKMTKSYKSELGRLKADPFVKCVIETVESFIKEMSPIIEVDKEELPSWLGKRCDDCGNKKCKKLGILPKGYDCALWQAESEE